MVEIADIEDYKTLRNWLLETKQPREALVWLAHRVAIRTLPVFWAQALTLGHSPLPVLRVSLVISIAALARPELLTYRSYAERTRAAADAAYAAYFTNGTAVAAAAAADAANSADTTAVAAAAARAAAESAGTDAHAVWENVRFDCQLMQSVEHRTRAWPLWEAWPKDISIVWGELNRDRIADHWHFWLDCYERALAGEPQNWDLIEEIAFQPDAFWEGSDQEINLRIMALAEPRTAIEALSDDDIAKAAGNAPNAEQIIKNTQDKFEAVPKVAIDVRAFETAKNRAWNVVYEPPRVSRRVNHSEDAFYEQETLHANLPCRASRTRRSAFQGTPCRICQR